MLLERIPQSWSAPRAEQKACAPCLRQPPPHSPDHRGRGDVVGLENRGWSATHSPCLGRVAGASCFGPCSSSMLPKGAQPPHGHCATPASTQARAWPGSPPPDLPGPTENLQTSSHSPWLRRNTEFPSLPPFHPCMTPPCTTKALLHRISDNSQSCEMSEKYGQAGNTAGWEGAPVVGQARLKQPKTKGGAPKCQP